MAARTLVEAVNDALHVEMERDANVMVLGEDIGRAGGVFRATAGLLDRFECLGWSPRRGEPEAGTGTGRTPVDLKATLREMWR